MLLILTSLTMSTLLLDSPLTIGVTLLGMAFLISILLNLLSISWFCFIIFLIYIGGLLIMFAYFSALQPNQIIFMETFFTNIFFILMLLFITPPNIFIYNTPQTPFLWEMSLILNSSQSFIYLLIANILFLVLLVVVKITGTNSSPLRPMN